VRRAPDMPVGDAAVMTSPRLCHMRSYRSLVAWQVAHEFAILTLRSLDVPYDRRTQPLFDQLRRAAISIEANIVEGYALATPALLARHVRIAVGSAAEAECLVRLADELSHLPVEYVAAAQPLLDRTIGTLRGLLRRLRVVAPPPRTAHGARRT